MEIFAYENRGICFAGCADHFFSKDKIRTVIVFVIRKKILTLPINYYKIICSVRTLNINIGQTVFYEIYHSAVHVFLSVLSYRWERTSEKDNLLKYDRQR